MRNEINVEGKNIVTDLNILTGYFKIEVDGKKVLDTHKLTYISIILAIAITILSILTLIIWYQLGYEMGKQGMKPLLPRLVDWT